jgi:hypothetical protein
MTTAPTNQTMLFMLLFQFLFKVGPRPPPDLSVNEQILHRLGPDPP